MMEVTSRGLIRFRVLLLLLLSFGKNACSSFPLSSLVAANLSTGLRLMGLGEARKQPSGYATPMTAVLIMEPEGSRQENQMNPLV